MIDIFTVTYSFDYTKIDMKKLKETIPGLNLRDDNTLGYSEFKEALIKGGIKKNNSKFLNYRRRLTSLPFFKNKGDYV